MAKGREDYHEYREVDLRGFPKVFDNLRRKNPYLHRQKVDPTAESEQQDRERAAALHHADRFHDDGCE